MDLAATASPSFGNEERRRTERVLLGVALSVLVHGALLTAWRGGQPVALPEPPRPLVVRVQPPPAPPPPRAKTPEPPPPPAPARKPARPARAARPTTPPVIAVPPDTQRTGEPDSFVVEQPETPPAEAPRFDPEAAKRSARALANMRDPAKEGTAVGQFPEKPLETETRAARAIGAAKRRDCKDGVPGGLLAPLLLALDKKDSGCKW